MSEFLESLKGKLIRVVQEDNFIKYGKLLGFDEDFIYLEYDDGSKVAIARKIIKEIRETTKWS